jgi:hypothetical protein
MLVRMWGKKESSYTVGGHASEHNLFGKQYVGFFKNSI